MTPKAPSPSSTVGRQVFNLVLAVSMAFVTLSSVLLFSIELRAKKALVNGEIESFRATQVAGVAEGLWNFDDGILKAIADGIVNHPYLCRAAIGDGRGFSVSSGEGADGSEAIDIPIFRASPLGGELYVGTLRLEIDSRKIFAEAALQAMPVVLSQVLLLAIQSFVLLVFFSRRVARHLSRIAAYIIENDVRSDAAPLELDTRRRGDELDFLVDAYNRMREDVARSLREKEVLIQEIYHRTKNNMQLISAFLELEAEASEDGKVAGALRDMIGRITSMALVHQKLYMSKDLSRIDLGDYVRDLCSSIASACLQERRGVSVSVDAEPGIVSVIDLAVPCGLVLNELMVNSAKYAFAGRESGTITVRLRRVSASTLELTVSDDGVGLPPGFDYRRDGHVGLMTVVSIVEMQLRGELTLGPGPGTSFTARIRDDLFGPRL